MTRPSLFRIGVLLAACAVAFVHTLADELDDFAENLNQAWSETNTVAMLGLIDTRLNSDTNDVMALSARTYYYVFVDCNLTNARLAADHLYSVVQQENNSEAEAFCLEMKNEVYGISLSESGPYSQVQVEQIHAGVTTFPAVGKSLWLSKKLAEE